MADDERFDAFLSTIGFGKWQLPALASTILVMSTYPVHLIGSPFLNAPMPFRCSNGNQDSWNMNLTRLEDLVNNRSSYFKEECLVLGELPFDELPPDGSRSPRSTGLDSCPFIEYDTSLFLSTVISDFDLVCERAWLRPLYVTIFMIGGLIGSLVGGYIGDSWGRRRAVQLASTTNILVVIVTIFSPNYPLVLVMRLLAGISMTTLIVTAWSLSLECCPCKYRGLLGMLMGLPYSVLVIVFTGIAYLIRTWQFLFVASASPVLLLLPVSVLMDESPRWLLQTGKTDEAKKVLEKAVRLNKPETTSTLQATIDKLIEATTTSKPNTDESEKSLSSGLRKALEYIRTPVMCKIIFATAIIWFLHYILYMGVALNANNFTSEDPFLYVALTGVMDGTSILAITPLITRIGRRVILWAAFAVGGAFFLIELLIPEAYAWAKWVFVMGGFFLVAGSLQVNFMYAPELFPTESRARGFAFVQLMGNVGAACAPLITDVVSQYAWWAAGVTFGCSGIVGSFLLPLLPETRNQPLPETLEDVKKRTMKKAKKKEGLGEENEAYEETPGDNV